MNIGIIGEFREKNITGINRVVCGTLSNLLEIDKKNNYMFIGNTDYLPIKLSNISTFFDNSKELNLNYTMFSNDINLVHSYVRAFDFNKNFDCARILTIHDLVWLSSLDVATKDLIKYYNGPLRRCAEKADKIIADSNFTKMEIIEKFGVSEDKIQVIYPGLYPDKVSEKMNITKNLKKLAGTNFLLSVSGFSVYKNQKGLLKAFRVYKERHPNSDLKLVLTGPPRIRMEGIYEELVKIPNYEENVIFTGFVSDEELIWLYQNCLVYIFVSLYEGFGLTILEALSQGCAVICSNTTAMPEVGGQAVEYCNPYDTESILAAMENVIFNETRISELKSMAEKQADKFSYVETAKQTLEIYESFS